MVATTEEALFQLDDALLGEGLTDEVEWHLAQAAATYRNGPVAERHLKQAREMHPRHPAVLIGLYRFYFYKGRLCEALAVARVCLTLAADHLGLPDDWRLVQKQEIDFGNYAARWPRFYLFTLKAYAYLQLRLGQTSEGNDAVLKLLELDPTDKVGAAVLQNVVLRIGHDDDEY